MSSPSEDSNNFKAGHPRAVKVAGGMRITQHKNPEKERDIKAVKDPDEPKPSTSPPKAIVSGAQTKGNADFTPEAVQHYHDKPILPTHDCRPAHCSRPIVIQQPRK